LSAAHEPVVFDSAAADRSSQRRPLWELCEISIGYALILAVIWTPRPLQSWLYWLALAFFIVSVASSFPGWKALGFTASGFWRSSWVVGVALAIAAGAVTLAASLHTLHHPSGLTQWFFTFSGYTVWSFAQQFLLQSYFLARFLRLLPSASMAAIAAALVFSAAHLPNPILTALTLVWGLAACFIFLRARNLYPLAIAHAIFGICIAITVPATTLHNMRVGLGYLRYHAPHHPHLNQSDHRVSTVAWVSDDAPTRR